MIPNQHSALKMEVMCSCESSVLPTSLHGAAKDKHRSVKFTSNMTVFLGVAPNQHSDDGGCEHIRNLGQYLPDNDVHVHRCENQKPDAVTTLSIYRVRTKQSLQFACVWDCGGKNKLDSF